MKINKTLADMKAAFREAGIEPKKDLRLTKRATSSLLTLFSLVEDSRIPGMCDYPLEYILLIAFLAVLGGAETWQEISDFGNAKKSWLRKFLNIKKYGIPSHDTFRRVFGLFNADQFERIIVDTLQNNLSIIRGSLNIVPEPMTYRQLCIDGKEENGTGRKYTQNSGGKVKNQQTLHIYDATDDICLYSRTIDRKTNEIPVAQEALETMNLKDSIVTFDALHTQKKTVAIILRQQGHYVGGLKGNQSGLLDNVSACFTDEVCESLKKQPGFYVRQVEKSHSQIEVREYFMMAPYKDKQRDKDWGKMGAFVLLRKTITPVNPKEETTVEDRYYISDLDSLPVIVVAIRNHWAVENSLHWHLDYSFKEDDNSTMDPVAYRNLGTMNKLCLHLCQLIKATEQKPVSIRRIRKSFGWNYEDNIARMLSLLNDSAILKAIKNEQKRTLKDANAVLREKLSLEKNQP